MVEEVEVGGDVFAEAAAAGEGFAGGGVEGNVEGLGVGAELMTLQVAPLGTDGAEGLLLALGVGDDHLLRQGRLVVDVKRNQHIIFLEDVGHTGVVPYRGFHLTAVDAAKAGEVDEDGFALGTSSCHACIIVFVFRFDDGGVEIEVLSAHGWCEGADGLAGSTP